MNEKVAIVSDFDGTISVRDIGHHFFGTFIPDQESRRHLLHSWKIGLISSRECLEREIEWIEADVDDLNEFINKEKLDPYIKDFVDFCHRRNYEITILSDGLDYYIDRLLMKFGLGFLDFKANHLMMNNGSITGVDFPYYNTMDCTMCGNCKRYHLERMKDQGYYAVYVGNGYSDRCPAENADMVLAKGDLLEHFRQEKLAYIPFENFRDVERELTNRLILSE